MGLFFDMMTFSLMYNRFINLPAMTVTFSFLIVPVKDTILVKR